MRDLRLPYQLLSLLLIVTLPVFSQRPNIIYIMADDLGYADLSCYGRKEYQTPNLDKLASQGVKFLNAYAAAPVCTPTRAAFMTGRYPARTPVGLLEPITGVNSDSLAGLPAGIPTLPRLLKKAGYETILIGKWHLGSQPGHRPLNHGFDYFYGFTPGAIDYISHSKYFFENENPVRQEGYFTDLLEKKTVDLINGRHEKPFFMALMFNAPHWPWQGPTDAAYHDTLRWSLGGSPAVFAAMVKSLDDAIGRIMKSLDESGQASNTVVIFTSDNGGERFSDMGIYKGRKMQLWEGGTRVPAFVRWPGKIKPRSNTRQVAITMDWTATILSLAGASPDPEYPLDGMDLVPVMTGRHKEIDRTLYWRTFQRTQHKALREGRWKYLKDEKGEYLFNLETDPREKHDLKMKNRTVFESLKQKYKTWESGVLAPIPIETATKKE